MRIGRASRLISQILLQRMLPLRPSFSKKIPTSNRNSFFSNLDKTLRKSLTEAVSAPFWFDTTRYPNHIDIRVQVDEGVLRFIAARERVFAPTGYVFIFWLITTTVVLSLVSILFIRRQSDPIRELADAAAAFGKGQDISNFKPRGASEVRLAGQSFLKMRQRIRRHLEQRMDEMEAMLNGYLDFARGMGKEKPQRIALSAFIQKSVETRPLVFRRLNARMPSKPFRDWMRRETKTPKALGSLHR